jgi:cytosine/adenosine deaminase-related metal-dependent hydrolase
VLVRGDRIADVGPLEVLVRAHPAEPVERNDGCLLLPGLVNAHTHLALTVLGGLLPSVSFGEWLPLLVRAMRALTPEALEASVALGAQWCLESGVTVVGEIAYGSASMRIARRAGLGGAFLWEVLGIQPGALDGALAGEGFPTSSGPGIGDPRMRVGISPHSPYTSGPELLRATHARASAGHMPYAIHVAESHAEAELFEQGGGALAGTAGRFAMGLAPGSGITPVRYLDDLGVLDGALAIHCVQLGRDDACVLAAKTSGVVLCPRSNAYLREGPAPVTVLEAAGARLALGTDSLASNLDLDLLDECRAVRRLAPALTAERVVRMITSDGAAALGMGGTFGSLAAGFQADLAVFRCAADATDPYEGLVGCAGRPSLESVMSGGVWRVREGRALEAVDAAAVALLDQARNAAQAALA